MTWWLWLSLGFGCGLAVASLATAVVIVIVAETHQRRFGALQLDTPEARAALRERR